MSTEAPRPETAQGTRRHRTLAWWSLALLPVSLALAFVAGEGTAALLGMTDEQAAPPPLWVMALVLAAAAVVFAAPLLLTWRFSSRAARAGENGAWMPLIVGGAVVGAFVLANLASGLLVLVFG